jgi:hypothetical protein
VPYILGVREYIFEILNGVQHGTGLPIGKRFEDDLAKNTCIKVTSHYSTSYIKARFYSIWTYIGLLITTRYYSILNFEYTQIKIYDVDCFVPLGYG